MLVASWDDLENLIRSCWTRTVSYPYRPDNAQSACCIFSRLTRSARGIACIRRGSSMREGAAAASNRGNGSRGEGK
jgi:hypothetical protein